MKDDERGIQSASVDNCNIHEERESVRSTKKGINRESLRNRQTQAKVLGSC